MNKKLETWREAWVNQTLATIHSTYKVEVQEQAIRNALNAAIELNLAVKFIQWERIYRMEEMDKLQKYEGDDKKTKFKAIVSRFRNTEELFNYWLDNVLKLK